MKTHILEITWLPRGFLDFGWGNGYVLIPKGHPLHGINYLDIDVDVHGDLTYSELINEDRVKRMGLDDGDIGMWCVGFDTVHHGDSLSNWPKERVQLETERLKEQLLTYKL